MKILAGILISLYMGLTLFGLYQYKAHNRKWGMRLVVAIAVGLVVIGAAYQLSVLSVYAASLAWLAVTPTLWVGIAYGLWRVRHNGSRRRFLTLAAVTSVGAATPTVIVLVSAWVLFQASPTMQFNVGSEYAMNLWSFWVDACRPLFLGSGVLALVCFVWAMVASALGRFNWKTNVIYGGFLSSLLGLLVLAQSFPTV